MKKTLYELKLKMFQHSMMKFVKLMKKKKNQNRKVFYQDDFLAGLSAFLNLSGEIIGYQKLTLYNRAHEGKIFQERHE